MPTPDPLKTVAREIPLRDEAPALHTAHSAESSAAPVHEPYDDQWMPPLLTTAPPPMAGMVQRWIRVKLDGVDDPGNVARKMMEGWVPRPAASVPQGFFAPVTSYGQYGNVVGNSDSILMQRPVAMHEGYARHYRSLADRQNKSVKDYVRSGMPMQHGTSGGAVDEFNVRTSKGRSTPRVADDD